ncbi:hypothetical protein [Pseudomonas typographi]|uniref:Uncharacterized protein n=1 Tax=Pseudomonas typographi TaxID=2715964 RepID=A0ABR7Z7C5_9PSED|nr:hypothetical protein [Pseudomonas typographi]MBD1553827.1 hypothetical protein [Pseudomonas typographi]MBD1588521.1 hypothetical protein [Pseudomonas typographi]MBD1601223.1 hypothetical protein [Pseudomonas typographi]
MTTVRIDADIKARWLDGQCSFSPDTPEELAIIGIDLLVRELGIDAARTFIDQAFERFSHVHWPLAAGKPAETPPVPAA